MKAISNLYKRKTLTVALLALSILGCTALSVSSYAQEDKTLESTMTKAVKRSKDDSFLTFSIENDLLGGGTDRNYTSGVRLTYFNLGTPMPQFAHTIDKALPMFKINETTSVFYSIGQNLYTPRDITIATPVTNDRPWAAFLYTSAGFSTIRNNFIDNVELTAGIVGSGALGEQTQKFIHKYISDSPEPMGWDHQLKNEPALMLSWERSWPERFGTEALGWAADAVPHLGATVGNIYTYANTGLSFHLSPYDGRFQDAPLRVRPSMPGTGAFLIDENQFSWYLFGGVEGRAVARNIFLDGNTFTNSYSVDKKPLVGDATAGIALTYGHTRLSYTLVYRTEEFETQDGGDIFGSINLGFRF